MRRTQATALYFAESWVQPECQNNDVSWLRRASLSPLPDTDEQGESAVAGQKMVRLCAFDFSTVGMPLDTTVGSEQQGEGGNNGLGALR